MTILKIIFDVLLLLAVIATTIKIWTNEKIEADKIKKLETDIDLLKERFRYLSQRCDCAYDTASKSIMKNHDNSQDISKVKENIQSICEHLKIEFKHEKHSRFTHKG